MASGYDFQVHTVAVRMRVSGSGDLHTELRGLEDSPTQVLADTTLQSNPSRPVNLLANHKAMKTQVYGYVNAIDEHFHIKNITLYVRPSGTGYPQ